MINPILTAPAFMARLFPVNNLDSDFLYDQLKLLQTLPTIVEELPVQL